MALLSPSHSIVRPPSEIKISRIRIHWYAEDRAHRSIGFTGVFSWQVSSPLQQVPKRPMGGSKERDFVESSRCARLPTPPPDATHVPLRGVIRFTRHE